jgi:pimeloyl-ACP methyl ester carboxylesterase
LTPPYYREAGSGSGVVCIHANASTSGQWRGLMDLLAPTHHVFAPDSYDSGKGPRWPSDRIITLRDEAVMLEPVFAAAGTPFTLVGHSYGAGVALIAALMDPSRVRAMALYEPTIFSLVEQDKPAPNDVDGIRGAVVASTAALDANDTGTAARHFIDFWMGEGSWARMPEERKPPIAASCRNVRRWAHALMKEPTPLAAFRSLDIPVLYMTGKRSKESAHGVARLLTKALPKVEVLEFEKLGHMGPVTHPEPVNAAIAQFLARH